MFSKFFKKKETNKKDKDVYFSYDIKPYINLKYNMIFSHDSCIYDDEKVVVMARRIKKVLLKFVLVSDYDHYRKLDLSNEKLIELNKDKEFEYGFKIEDINSEFLVQVTIFEQKNEETKKYSIEMSKATKTEYLSYLVYDEETVVLNMYKRLRNYGPLFNEYQTAMFYDVGAKDPEEE